MPASLESVLPTLILPILLACSVILGRLLAGPLVFTPVHSPFEKTLLYGLCGCIAFSWVGTLLAGLGMFRWWLLVIALLACVAWVTKQGHAGVSSSTHADCRRTPVCVLILLVLVLSGAGWLFARPAESFFVFNDAAVYTIGGVTLARTGSLFFEPDSFWTTSYEFLRQFFFIDPFDLFARHYGPFYQWTPMQSTLEIGFLPLPKVWMAMVVWLCGPERATWATPFLGLVSLVVLYSLTERLLGWQAGLMALLLLGVSLPQIWFSRDPISEIYTQLFFLSGLYLAALARQNASNSALARRLALWSGLSFATLTILRLEGALMLLALASLLWVGWHRFFTKLPGFAHTWLVSVTVAGSVGLALGIGVSPYYFFSRAIYIVTPGMIRLVLFALLVGVTICGLGWRWRQSIANAHLRTTIAQMVAKYLPVAIAVGWALWGGMAGWHLYSRDWGRSLAGWLAQYWTVPGVILSLAGAVWLLLRQYDQAYPPELLTLLGLALAFLVGFSIRSYVYPIHPWAMRRLVPVVMPAMAMTAVSLFTAIEPLVRWERLARFGNRLRQAVAWLFVVGVLLLACAIGQRSVPILFHRERAGLWAQLQTVAEQFPADAVLLFDNGASQGLTQAMELLFGRVSLVIQRTPAPDGESEVDTLIEAALEQDRPVYLIITNGDLAWWPERWQLVSEGAFRIEMPVLRQPVGRLPAAEDVTVQTLWLDTYQVKPRTDSGRTEDLSEPIHIPVGSGNYPYLRDGFHHWYADADGNIMRWTDGDAMIVTPWPDANPESPADFCIKVDLAGGRPQNEPPARLTVVAEGVELLDEQLSKAFVPQTFTIPARSIENGKEPQLEIQLISTTWDASSIGDDRILGVLFYGMQVLPFEQCSFRQ